MHGNHSTRYVGTGKPFGLRMVRNCSVHQENSVWPQR